MRQFPRRMPRRAGVFRALEVRVLDPRRRVTDRRVSGPGLERETSDQDRGNRPERHFSRVDQGKIHANDLDTASRSGPRGLQEGR